MWVFSCAWKINFSKIIFSWPGVLKALTRKLFEVKIFTSNHFRTHAQREREREPRSLLRPSSNPTTTGAPVRRPQTGLVAPHQRQSTLAPIKQRSTPTPLDLASIVWSDEFFFWVLFHLCFYMTGFDEFFFLVLFLLYFSIEEWYYIFVWQLRKCIQQVENVFSMVFSRTQPNTRKYFSKHFLKCNQTLENIFLSRK